MHEVPGRHRNHVVDSGSGAERVSDHRAAQPTGEHHLFGWNHHVPSEFASTVSRFHGMCDMPK